jgi:hypothetical protein
MAPTLTGEEAAAFTRAGVGWHGFRFCKRAAAPYHLGCRGALPRTANTVPPPIRTSQTVQNLRQKNWLGRSGRVPAWIPLMTGVLKLSTLWSITSFSPSFVRARKYNALVHFENGTHGVLPRTDVDAAYQRIGYQPPNLQRCLYARQKGISIESRPRLDPMEPSRLHHPF